MNILKDLFFRKKDIQNLILFLLLSFQKNFHGDTNKGVKTVKEHNELNTN